MSGMMECRQLLLKKRFEACGNLAYFSPGEHHADAQSAWAKPQLSEKLWRQSGHSTISADSLSLVNRARHGFGGGEVS